jgi:hypothetical protein
METENDNAATIAEVINSHQQIPHNGGWTCAAKDCPWTYDDSPLPLAEAAKHQADVIAKTLHPVAAPSVEQIESVLGEHIHPGDVSSTPVIAEAIHALYGTPGDSGVPADAYNELAENYHAENERLRAALEAAEALVWAEQSYHAAKANYASAGEGFKDAHGLREKRQEQYDAARAAVEADTAEGA